MSDNKTRVEKLLYPQELLEQIKRNLPFLDWDNQEFTGNLINKLVNNIKNKEAIIEQQRQDIAKHNEAIKKLEARLQEKVKNVSEELLAIQTMMNAYSFEIKFFNNLEK